MPSILCSPAAEQPQPDEVETPAELDAAFDIILERTSGDYGPAVRAVHAEAHAVLQSDLTLKPSLSLQLAQGLIAAPGTTGRNPDLGR